MNNYAAEAAIGAAALTREASDNPFKMVYRLVDQHPGMDKNALFELFQVEIADSESFRRAVDLYFFTNAYSYATSARNHRPAQSRRGPGRVGMEERTEAIKAQIIMLDLTMPNGKAMRDCTFQEMAMFGNRFTKLAAMGKKTELVGVKLTEEQVKAIMK
ncbi:hypothetical protein ACVWZ4_000010 [Bradyrhizobium sp. USDA 4472]